MRAGCLYHYRCLCLYVWDHTAISRPLPLYRCPRGFSVTSATISCRSPFTVSISVTLNTHWATPCSVAPYALFYPRSSCGAAYGGRAPAGHSLNGSSTWASTVRLLYPLPTCAHIEQVSLYYSLSLIFRSQQAWKVHGPKRICSLAFAHSQSHALTRFACTFLRTFSFTTTRFPCRLASLDDRSAPSSLNLCTVHCRPPSLTQECARTCRARP